MVYTLTGANSFELGSFFSQLKSDFVSKYGNDGIENYSGEQLTPEIITNAFGGVSLFSTNRLVVIRGLVEAKEVTDLLMNQIKTVSDEVTVVLIEPNLDKRTSLYKTLKKETQFKEFGNLQESELVSWIQLEVKTSDGVIDSANARLLYEYCGPDQMRLSNEIQKLLAYDSSITKESIELLVERNPNDTIFELLELAMSDQSNKAVSKLLALEAVHEDPFQIASMLIWQTHILAIVQTANGLHEAEIAKIHKINPYVVSKTKRLASKSNTNKLKRIVDTVANLDLTLKSNAYDPWRVLEQTLFSL